MKECLNCNKEFEPKRESGKYCSDNCRVQWNRKNPKQEKGLTELQQMKVMYNTLIEKIDKLNLSSVYLPVNESKQSFDTTLPKNKKIMLKRTPMQWVELRRDCQNSDDYNKWIVDLDNDTHLTQLEKKQIKATI
jgi:hypothetical protein